MSSFGKSYQRSRNKKHSTQSTVFYPTNMYNDNPHNSIVKAKKHISDLLHSYISEFEQNDFPSFFENYNSHKSKLKGTNVSNKNILNASNLQSNRSSNSNTKRSSLHLLNESKATERTKLNITENNQKQNKSRLSEQGENILHHKKSSFQHKEINNTLTKSNVAFNNEIEINNIQGLTKSNMVELRNICDKLKQNICAQSSKDSLKTTETKQYQNENDSSPEYSMANSVAKISKDKFRCLIKKGYVYDSLDDEEVEDEINDNFYISPNSKFVFYFDMVIFISMFYTILYTPLSLAKEDYIPPHPSKFFLIIEMIIDCVCIVDIIIRFFLAYFTFDEILITKLNLIALHYIFTWFIIDIISALPFNSLLLYKLIVNHDFFPAISFGTFGKNIREIFRLNRIIKIIKVLFSNTFGSYLFKAIFKINHLSRWNKLYLSIFTFIIALHILSSIFIFIGKTAYPNWIMSYLPNEKNFNVLYLHSLYYILSSIYSIGYGDILSKNMHERIFNLFLMLFGIMIYSWGLSSISTYIQTKDAKTIEFQHKCEILDEIRVTHEKMSDELYEKIYRFLNYKLENEKKDRNTIIDSLPIGLRNNLIYEMYKPIIENFIFFKNFNNTDFIVRVLMCFKPILSLKNDILVKEGDYIEEILFVKKGNLSLQLPLPDLDQVVKQREKSFLRRSVFNRPLLRQKASLLGLENRVSYEDLTNDELNRAQLYDDEISCIHIQILEIRKNEHFGDILMFLNRKSPLSVKVKSKIVELFLLKKTDAVRISMSYPKIWNKIIKRSLFNMEQIDRLVNRAIKLFYNANKSKFTNLMRYKKKISGTLYHTIMNLNSTSSNISGVNSKFNYLKSQKLTNIYKIANVNTSRFELKTIPSISQSALGSDENKSSEQSLNDNTELPSNANNYKSERTYENKNEDNEEDNQSDSSNMSNQVIENIDSNSTIEMNIDDGLENVDINNISKNQTEPTHINNTNNTKGYAISNQSFSIKRKFIESSDISSNTGFKEEDLCFTCPITFTVNKKYDNLISSMGIDITKAKELIDKVVQCGIEELNNIMSYLDSIISTRKSLFNLVEEKDTKSVKLENRTQLKRCYSLTKTRKSIFGDYDKKSMITLHNKDSIIAKKESNPNPIKQQKKSLQNFLQKKDNFIKVATFAFNDEKANPSIKLPSLKNLDQITKNNDSAVNQKKNDNNLLAMIHNNIENNAFNLENPELFYSEYFQKIMDKEQGVIYEAFLLKKLEKTEMFLKQMSKIKKDNEDKET